MFVFQNVQPYCGAHSASKWYRSPFMGLKRPVSEVHNWPPSSTGLRMSATVPLLSLYTIISWTATVFCYRLSFLTTACSAWKSCATYIRLHTESCNECRSYLSRLTRDELGTGIVLRVASIPAVRNPSVLVSYLEYATQLVQPSKAVRVCH